MNRPLSPFTVLLIAVLLLPAIAVVAVALAILHPLGLTWVLLPAVAVVIVVVWLVRRRRPSPGGKPV